MFHITSERNVLFTDYFESKQVIRGGHDARCKQEINQRRETVAGNDLQFVTSRSARTITNKDLSIPLRLHTKGILKIAIYATTE